MSHLINRIKGAVHEHLKRHPLISKLTGHEARSHQWPTFERHWLEKNGMCAACGGTTKLNVHHIKPFHRFPELELDETNFITLCMGPLECHLKVGHGDLFRAWNPEVVKDAQEVRLYPEDFQAVAQSARARRVIC
jgi:5-methylcytosine-specific restriction enzyme A